MSKPTLTIALNRAGKRLRRSRAVASSGPGEDCLLHNLPGSLRSQHLPSNQGFRWRWFRSVPAASAHGIGTVAIREVTTLKETRKCRNVQRALIVSLADPFSEKSNVQDTYIQRRHPFSRIG
jgi:hypothetical protein